jgi:hypothetical protein
MPGSDLERRPVRLPVPVERRRESEAAIPRAFRAYRRRPDLAVPWTVPVACWACAQVMHSAVPDGTLITVVATGIGGGMMAFLAPSRWDRPVEVLYVRLSAGALFTWESLAAWQGPGTPWTDGLLVVLAAAWGIPWWRHKRPRGRKERKRLFREWEGPWQHNAPRLGLGGSTVIDVTETPAMTRVRLQLVRGSQTIADVKAALPRIESMIDDIDEGRVSVHKVPGHRSQAELRVKRENPLAEGIPWDESIAPRSVLDPWYPGRTEAAEWRPMTQLGAIFAIGMKGSGKSTLLLTRILSLAGCDDAFSILIDLKGGRSARPVLETGAADWVITTLPEAELAHLLLEAEILARSEGMYDGHEQATPTRRDPAIFMHVDETFKLTSVAKGSKPAADSMAVIASTGRSALVQEDVFTQHGSLEDSVRTEQTRMNLDLRFAFRMPRPEHAAFAIKEYAKYDVSRLEEPGECYATDAPGADPDERLRGVNVSHDEFRRLAPPRIEARGPKPRLKLWCGSQPCPAGGTWQEFLDSRWGRLPAAFRDISPQYREWADGREIGAPDDAVAATAVSPAVAAPAPAWRRAPVDPEAAEVAARIRDDAEPYKDVTSGPLPAGTLNFATVQAGQEARMLDVLAASSPGAPVTVRQLCDASGLSSSTAYDKLGRLVALGAVVKVRQGLYAQAHGADVRAATASVKAGDDALTAEARRGTLHVVHTA